MIDLLNLGMQFGGNYLFEDVNIKINRGDKIALVGSNGSGKSTLLKLLSGQEQPEHGDILKTKNTKIAYLPQEFIHFKGKTIFREVKNSIGDVAEIETTEREINTLLDDDSISDAKKEELLLTLGEIEHKKDDIDYYTIDSRIEKILEGLGFTSSDFNRLTDEFSGGWQMRIHLAKILLGQNDLILLDEPTNHLDIDSLRWLVGFLKEYRGSLLIVSHDKYFVNSVTTKTLEIFNKKLSFYNGKYDAYLNYKTERDEQLIKSFEQQQKKIKETEAFIERFRYKATKAKQVQSRIKQLEKIEELDLPDSENKIKLRFPEPPRSGTVPVTIEDISMRYGTLTVFENLDLQIERGDKIAFVGPNGAGKTTLAKIIAGKLNPTSGKFELGYNTSVAYYAQEVAENLDLSKDILDTVYEISEKNTPGQLRNLLGCFLFSDDDIFKKIGVLSGGEKSRVALARILLQKANLVILDEPTNHLDLQSKEVLQDALKEFPGTIIIVSHDVEFIRPITNKTVEIRNGALKLYHGDIDYYLEKIADLKETEKSRQDKANDKQVSRKDQKRLEAELRKQKTVETKDLKKSLDKTETKIAELEEIKEDCEAQLAEESLYNDPDKAREVSIQYDKTKAQLDELFTNWAEISEQLEEIDKKFEELGL